MPSATDDTLIPTPQVRARYGGVSHMWIERRLVDDPTFPKPVYIANRRFWRVAELVAWERELATRNTRELVAA
jgi:predicted DNA-binding transcriptional regulator AlpA